MSLFILNRSQKIRLKNTMLAAGGAVILSLVLIYARFANYTLLTATQIYWALALFWIVNFIIIGILISGFNARFKDPSLSLPQMYWASTSAIAALSVTHHLDALFYLLILITLVFGIFRVTVKQFRVFGLYLIVLLLAALAVNGWHIEPESSFFDEILIWVTFSFCVLVLMSICSSIVILRARLKAKNAELQHALEIKSRFLANMSHEIRTPMNGVLGMLELSLMENIGDNVKNYLKIAQTSGRELLNIINDILDFSKLEAGKVNIENTSFDLHDLLDSVAQTFQANCSKKGLSISVNIDENVPHYVNTDSGRLRQILNNIIGNAVKFTEKGGVEISLTASKIRKNILKIEFCVVDTGIGIDSQKLENLFESFTQADASTTRVYGGTGLGLAISKELCVLMNGNIEVESIVGKGSRFHFWIEAKEGQKPLNNNSEVRLCNLDNKRVLVVEDNKTNQEVVMLALETMNIQSDIANHGGEALDLLQQSLDKSKHYDLILMDCQMPVLDGYQTTRIIRSDESLGLYNLIPIVAMTANAMKGDREKCLRSGMNDYMVKPVDFALLKSTLCEWLDDNTPRTLLTNSTGLSSLSKEDIELKIWDKDELVKAIGGKTERVGRLVNSFLKNLPDIETNIQTAVAEQNAEQLRHLGHALKGSAANLRAKIVADKAAKMERAAAEKDWEKIRELLISLKEALNQTKEFISKEQSESN